MGPFRLLNLTAGESRCASLDASLGQRTSGQTSNTLRARNLFCLRDIVTSKLSNRRYSLEQNNQMSVKVLFVLVWPFMQLELEQKTIFCTTRRLIRCRSCMCCRRYVNQVKTLPCMSRVLHYCRICMQCISQLCISLSRLQWCLPWHVGSTQYDIYQGLCPPGQGML